MTLTVAEEIVARCASQDSSTDECLDDLRAHGLTADREALSEAVAAIRLRDMWLSREGDPVAFTGVEFRPGISVWDMAVELAEQSLESHLRILAVRA